MKTPDAKDGQVFYFPIVQTCLNGSSNPWTQLNDSGEYPAPSIILTLNGTVFTPLSRATSSASHLTIGVVGALVGSLFFF